MLAFTTRSHVPILGVLALMLLLTGCRTYGGYDTEARTYAQMQQANSQFADDLTRAEGELDALQNAASTNANLEPMAEHYADLVESHRETLETHQALVESLSADTGYRTLSRQYGRLVTEQRMLGQQYRSVTERVYAAVTGNPEPTRMVPESESYTTPYIYRRMENQPMRTMSAALNGRL
ncbi:hypothetical protein CRI93_08485 [Longimonas halophila]|uniref:Uncharacterized protein n=1 Tax=Longimonas halophila TaxID=1469170 RepID=A0A2H3P4T3_9BACT|nr:hypothetical protein [Longimonas halophila]PEN06672.1 hypothetical protein CRI93_08485 [Longimonas halophila]